MSCAATGKRNLTNNAANDFAQHGSQLVVWVPGLDRIRPTAMATRKFTKEACGSG
jgi:hypothetical protein